MHTYAKRPRRNLLKYNTFLGRTKRTVRTVSFLNKNNDLAQTAPNEHSSRLSPRSFCVLSLSTPLIQLIHNPPTKNLNKNNDLVDIVVVDYSSKHEHDLLSSLAVL